MQVRVSTAQAVNARETMEHTSELMLAEYLDRSANDFALACADVRVARRETSLRQMRERLDVALERLQSLAMIRSLLQPRQTAVMDLSNELGDLCHYHAQARFAELGVFVQLRAGDITIDSRRGRALLMIVSELLTSAAHGAFHAPGCIIKVDIAHIHTEIICVVSEDGLGLKRTADNPGGIGAIVTELACYAGFALNAQMCRLGTSVELRLPADCG